MQAAQIHKSSAHIDPLFDTIMGKYTGCCRESREQGVAVDFL